MACRSAKSARKSCITRRACASRLRALRRTRNVFTLRAASAHGDSKLKVSTSGSSEWQRIDTPPGRVLFVYRPCCWTADATCGDRVWRALAAKAFGELPLILGLDYALVAIDPACERISLSRG